MSGESIVNVKLVPETWIIAPSVSKEQMQRYVDCGWFSQENIHIDRAFPRNHEGVPLIFRIWLRSPMNSVVTENGYDRNILDFQIVDEEGNPINYVKVVKWDEGQQDWVPDNPQIYRRSISSGKTTETFEYIDGTYSIEFKIKTSKPKELIEVLYHAGKTGLLSRTKHGYGKFVVECSVEG